MPRAGTDPEQAAAGPTWVRYGPRCSYHSHAVGQSTCMGLGGPVAVPGSRTVFGVLGCLFGPCSMALVGPTGPGLGLSRIPRATDRHRLGARGTHFVGCMVSRERPQPHSCPCCHCYRCLWWESENGPKQAIEGAGPGVTNWGPSRWL